LFDDLIKRSFAAKTFTDIGFSVSSAVKANNHVYSVIASNVLGFVAAQPHFMKSPQAILFY
jgi:hypothetical protein